MSDVSTQHQVAEWIRVACLMEVIAPKPGNVHPDASFADVTCDDFVRSAEAIAPVLSRAGELGVGQAILSAVQATQQTVGSNTNLGIILLLAPLSAVPLESSLPAGVRQLLAQLTIDDARRCYAAIRLARPGGLGSVEKADVSDEPEANLVELMTLAAERDRVAAQYANGYPDVLECGLKMLAESYEPQNWRQSVVRLQLQLMSQFPDTLIARKCGWEVARASQLRAQRVLDAGWPDSVAGKRSIESLDHWLREDGHRRNPGTTADLVAAILFAALREGVIAVPGEFAV